MATSSRWTPRSGRCRRSRASRGTGWCTGAARPTTRVRWCRPCSRCTHAGVNAEGGRNALVSLARIVSGELPDCALADLLAFAAFAGADLRGKAMGLDAHAAPGWGGWTVNVATLRKEPRLAGKLAL